MTTTTTTISTAPPAPAAPDRPAATAGAAREGEAFPVVWEQPGDAKLYWTRQRIHWAEPRTPLSHAFSRHVIEAGINPAAAAYDLPFRFEMRSFNTYLYYAIRPIGAPPDPVVRLLTRLRSRLPKLVDALQDAAVAPLVKRAQARLWPVMARLADLWADEWLPEVQRHHAYWDAFDLPGAALPALLAHLDETVARHRRLWEIHMLAFFPFVAAMSLFEERYAALFGPQHGLDAHRLLQGYDHKTLQCDRALWRLSRQALASPGVRAAFETHAAADVLPALERATDGPPFLAVLRAYLHEYGRRSSTFIELSEPCWIEDATPVLELLKDHLSQPDRDLEAEFAALASERERAVAAARARLQGNSAAAEFEALLEAAQEAVFVSEDHAYWIDHLGPYQVRRVLLELGRRLAAAGAIDEVDDVFYLTIAELPAVAARPDDTAIRRRIAERRAELVRFRAVRPPEALGTLPPGPPPPDMPIVRAMDKFLGKRHEGPPGRPLTAAPAAVLHGTAGSPGKARGPARVIRSLGDAHRLGRGDVLVTEATLPPWTPLFATAAAVVTDVGGVLSHCAVVAREYGIPAVVGTRTATATIRDGQLIEVDGSAGLVRLTP
jgi:pyruvate,water dikinase